MSHVTHKPTSSLDGRTFVALWLDFSGTRNSNSEVVKGGHRILEGGRCSPQVCALLFALFR